ncbi:IS3 family transposase, partial [Escherichia coli]|nr:IS3 family transposase [Escherichia coli]
MTKNTRFSPEVRQRAVRMVLESQGEYHSQWAALREGIRVARCTVARLMAVMR